MSFQEFMDKQGVTYSDFKTPEEMDKLINNYAKHYLSTYYAV